MTDRDSGRKLIIGRTSEGHRRRRNGLLIRGLMVRVHQRAFSQVSRRQALTLATFLACWPIFGKCYLNVT